MGHAIERHALVFQDLELREEGNERLLWSEEVRRLFPHVCVLEEVLKEGLLQLSDLEDLDVGHRLEPLDHPTLVRDRIEQLEGVHGHHPDIGEPACEVFDEWAVVEPDHVEDSQID